MASSLSIAAMRVGSRLFAQIILCSALMIDDFYLGCAPFTFGLSASRGLSANTMENE